MIKRYCKTLLLKNDPGLIKEYVGIHKPGNIWPEVIAGICGIGIYEMELYLVNNQVFMITDTEPGFDHERDFKDIISLPRQTEWEEYVGRFQDVYPGRDAGEKWALMDKVFGLDEKPYQPALAGQTKIVFPDIKRYCKTLKLRNDPQLIAEYKKYHELGGVWPEIIRAIREVGILDQEIYLKDRDLFLILDTPPQFKYDEAMAELAVKPRHSEWQILMSNYQVFDPEKSTEPVWTLCERIFKLTDCVEK